MSKEEETRVKALGFLKDKRTPDKFNGRVITRNGKITAEEARAIAQAAESRRGAHHKKKKSSPSRGLLHIQLCLVLIFPTL